MNKKIVVLFLCCFFSAALLWAQEVSEKNNEKSSRDFKTPETELFDARLSTILDIKPGMTIADIGTGRGYYALCFADALKNTGHVYATDIDKKILEPLEENIKKSSYTNISSVLVGPDGDDPFYKSHTFDIIFLSAVYDVFPDPLSYFRKLRTSLKKDGRLFIITPVPDVDAIGLILDREEETFPAFFAKGENFPVVKRLSRENRDYLKHWNQEQKKPEMNDEVRARFRNDFERMLADKTLFNDIAAFYKKEPREPFGSCLLEAFPKTFPLIRWLVLELNKKSILENTHVPLTPEDENHLRALNTSLLVESSGLSKPGSLFIAIFPRKEGMVRTLKKAGYRWIREYDFTATEYCLEFKSS
jgi:protein-L-isoaspartate O-methyltransferase